MIISGIVEELSREITRKNSRGITRYFPIRTVGFAPIRGSENSFSELFNLKVLIYVFSLYLRHQSTYDLSIRVNV